MEDVDLKRKANDEIARERRRERLMIMKAKNKSRKPNGDDSSHDELDLNLSLAPPGQCPNQNTNTNNNNNSNSINNANNNIIRDCNTNNTITSISCARDISSKNSQIKKPRRRNNPSTSSVPAPTGANDGVVWPISKQLTESDVTGRQNRLFVEKKKVDVSYIMNKLNDEEKKTVSEGGFQIPVVDADTGEIKRLKFSYWQSTNSYIFNGEWQTKFVDERQLKVKDTVGLRWDDNVENCDRRLIFSVLSRATPSTPNQSGQDIDNTPPNSNKSGQEINTPSSNPNESSHEINT